MANGITRTQANYISDILDGLFVDEIAAKRGVTEGTVRSAIHDVLGEEYKGVRIDTIKRSVFQKIIDDYKTL